MQALELDMRIKAEQAFYNAARNGKTIEQARKAAQAAARAVQTAYAVGKVSV